MYIAILSICFHLEGCFSLKEKRGRVGGLREKFGKATAVAVCEVSSQDLHQSSEYAFTIVGLDKSQINRQADLILEHCKLNLDAVITSHELEWL